MPPASRSGFSASPRRSWVISAAGLPTLLVVGEVFLSGISGSSVADTAAAARVFVPQLERMGYPRAFGAALSAIAGTLGPIIPPSILMVVYAWQANISLGKLFVAGIIPGLVMAGCIMATIAILARTRDFKPAGAFSASALWREFKYSSLALLMPVIIIVGFRAGVFTATEIAGVAAAYSLVVGMFIYRSIRLVDLPAIFVGTARETAVILAIVAAAAPFSWILAIGQAPQLVTDYMSSISTDPLVVLLILNLALLVAGMFMETIAIMIILVPILIPLLTSLQIDLVHFGIVLLVNLVIGQVHPPVGVLCFVAMAITRVRLGPLVRELWPFLIALVVALVIITYVPGLSLWLPHVDRLLREARMTKISEVEIVEFSFMARNLRSLGRERAGRLQHRIQVERDAGADQVRCRHSYRRWG